MKKVVSFKRLLSLLTKFKSGKASSTGGEHKIRFGILAKLILGFSIPVAFIVILGVTSYTRASKGLLSNYEQASNNTFNMATGYLEYVTEAVDAIAQQYIQDNDTSYFIRGLVYTDKQERLKFVTAKNNELLKKANLEKFIENIHIIGGEKIPVLTSDMENINGFYKEMKASEEGQKLRDSDTVSYWIGNHALIDEELGLDTEDYAVTLIRTFDMDSGCIVIDLSAESLVEFLKELEIGEGSLVGLITEDGRELLVRNDQLESAAEGVSEDGFLFGSQNYFIESLQSEEPSGSEYVKHQSEDYLYMYSKIGGTGMTICSLVPKSSFMQQANAIRLTTVIIVVLACLVAVTVGFLISNGIGRTLKEINRKLQKISQGDLTVQVSFHRRDEFATLASNITDTMNNMRSLVHKMAQVGGKVTDSAANVMRVSKTIALSNDNITQAVDEISHGIEGQAQDSQNCLLQMDELSQKITIVNHNLSEIEQLTEDIKTMVASGIDTMEKLIRQSEATNKSTRYVVENIDALEDKTRSIGDIVQVINDIADQTNLLSLNASIEAARAGDAGKGFAVVATEIRKLATKSMTSANEIKGVIHEIQQQTEDTVETAKEAQSVVSKQNDFVGHTIEAFHGMNTVMESLIANLSIISSNMKNMEVAREGTLNAVENISAISEETMATSGSIENTVSDQANAVATLEEAANEMDANAKELKEAINNFII